MLRNKKLHSGIKIAPKRLPNNLKTNTHLPIISQKRPSTAFRTIVQSLEKNVIDLKHHLTLFSLTKSTEGRERVNPPNSGAKTRRRLHKNPSSLHLRMSNEHQPLTDGK